MRIYYLFTVLSVFACTDQQKVDSGNETVHANASDTIVTNAPIVIPAGDYELISGRDTAVLALQVKDTSVSGTLQFKWYEKDHNNGTVKGVIRDSIIWVDYTFQSEGITSVREEAFLMRPDSLIRATGEIVNKEGKQQFSDKLRLKYDYGQVFVKRNTLYR
ncbi:MAG TPA: hypothetical protein VEZ55_02935 [Chitinophagaceae bacterium]|nr:hypothetical protein [Chitinophagaceae bacterium]